jgi:hypothetical protein
MTVIWSFYGDWKQWRLHRWCQNRTCFFVVILSGIYLFADSRLWPGLHAQMWTPRSSFAIICRGWIYFRHADVCVAAKWRSIFQEGLNSGCKMKDRWTSLSPFRRCFWLGFMSRELNYNLLCIVHLWVIPTASAKRSTSIHWNVFIPILVM